MSSKAGFILSNLFFLLLFSNAFGVSYDSLGTTKKAGQTFIIHQVDEGETLYSLSRRYGASVDLISQENPEVGSGLKIGQKLLIPFAKKTSKKVTGNVHIVKPSETLFSISRQYNVSTSDIKKWNQLKDNNISIGQELVIKKSKANVSEVVAPVEKGIDYTGKETHTVAASETLYSLSRQFNVSVDDLKKWNQLESNELSIGQVLIVSDKSKPVTPTNSSMLPANAEETTNTMEASTEPSVTISEIKAPETKVGPSENASQTIESKKISETGFAQVIEGSSETKKYLALHKTAPVGTIMQVKNTMNNQTVFVRVVGDLPNTGDNTNILLKISKKAFDRLGAVDSKFPVEISYVP